MRALEKDPVKRFQSASELGAALEAALCGPLPGETQPQPSIGTMVDRQKPSSGSPSEGRGVTPLGVVMLGLIAAVAAYLVLHLVID